MIRLVGISFVCFVTTLATVMAELPTNSEKSEITKLKRDLERACANGNEEEVREVEVLISKALKGEGGSRPRAEPTVDLTPRESDITVQGGGLVLRFGTNGHINQFRVSDSRSHTCLGATIYRIGDKAADVSAVEKTERGVRISLETADASAHVLVEGGAEVSVRFRETNAPHVTFGFGLPAQTKFHQGASHNLVDILDRERLMHGPVDSFGEGGFQILVAEVDRGFLSISGRSDYKHALKGIRRRGQVQVPLHVLAL